MSVSSCFSDACVNVLSEVHQAFDRLYLDWYFCFHLEACLLNWCLLFHLWLFVKPGSIVDLVVELSLSHLICCDPRTRASKTNLVYLVILGLLNTYLLIIRKTFVMSREDQATFSGTMDSATRRHWRLGLTFLACATSFTSCEFSRGDKHLC